MLAEKTEDCQADLVRILAWPGFRSPPLSFPGRPGERERNGNPRNQNNTVVNVAMPAPTPENRLPETSR